MPELTVEQEALDMGWIPQDKFRGDPAKWTDAATFVKRGKELLPILRAREQKLTSDLGTMKAQMAEMRSALTESSAALEALTKYHEETAQRAYEKARKDLLDQKKVELRALKEGDGDPDKIVELDDAIAALDAAKPAPVKEKTPASGGKPEDDAAKNLPPVHPDYPAWAEENKSWLADPTKAAYAGAMSHYLRAQHPTVVGRAFLDLVTEAVEEKFGGAPNKRVEAGGRPSNGGGRSNGHDYTDLPDDAKRACDRMADRLVGPNKAYKDVEAWRKQYCKDYDWS